MIRTTNIFEGKADGLELNKKLTRAVSECVRRVDEVIAAARSTFILFNPDAISARLTLRDTCEKAITVSKFNSGKFEEVLWRKVYYEPLSHAKKIRKGNTWQPSEIGVVWMHLDDGIAFYQQLIVSLNCDKKDGINADLLPSNFVCVDNKVENGSASVNDSIFRCLTYLGDLSRYLLDIPPYASLQTSYLVSVRYYHQALHCNREAGLTHSNLATVYSTSKQPLLAVMHFLRAMTCKKPFEAAEVSLKLILDKMKTITDKTPFSNGKDGKQCEDSAKFLNSCLLLVSNFLVNKNSEESSNTCQDVLVQLGNMLDNYDNDPFEVGDVWSPKSVGFQLDPESLVVLCAVFIICTKRLENIGSSQCNMSEVLIVSILLTLLTHINTRLEQRFSLVDPSFTTKLLPKIEVEESNSQTSSGSNNTNQGKEEVEKKSKKYSNLRRRRRKAPPKQANGVNGCLELNDSSDSGSEKDLSAAESDEEIDSFSLPSSEDELDDDPDVIVESDQEWEGLTAAEHFDLVSQEGMMAAVFVMLDWLCGMEHLLRSCTVSAKSLWNSLAKFFNLINVNWPQLTNAKCFKPHQELLELLKVDDENLMLPVLNSYYLPEEVMLHLVVPAIKQQLKMADQDVVATTLCRLIRLKEIKTKLLSKKNIPMKLENGVLIVTKLPPKMDPKKNGVRDDIGGASPKRNAGSPVNMRVTSSMQALTAQWLQHEVKNLEAKTKGGATLGGLYLVPDLNVMVLHLSAIKKIVVSGTHMVIIPQTVIDQLDLQKKDSSGAREAIRWLELKLSRGSRFVRVQRAHEKTKLPLIKYPKKKDLEAWQWFHLAECCYYLGAQMGYVTKKKKSTVTLLTGENGIKPAKRSFSQQTLVETSGALLMNVQDFMGKWHSSTKGQS